MCFNLGMRKEEGGRNLYAPSSFLLPPSSIGRLPLSGRIVPQRQQILLRDRHLEQATAFVHPAVLGRTIPGDRRAASGHLYPGYLDGLGPESDDAELALLCRPWNDDCHPRMARGQRDEE